MNCIFRSKGKGARPDIALMNKSGQHPMRHVCYRDYNAQLFSGEIRLPFFKKCVDRFGMVIAEA